jgi:hypothetical protein
MRTHKCTCGVARKVVFFGEEAAGKEQCEEVMVAGWDEAKFAREERFLDALRLPSTGAVKPLVRNGNMNKSRGTQAKVPVPPKPKRDFLCPG